MMSMNKGQSLFEVLFATALAALIVTGVASVALTSVRNAEYARTQSEARQVAQRMLEEARIYRDTNPTNFFSGTNPPLGGITQCGTEFDCTWSGTITTDTRNIVANVSWTDATGKHTVQAETVLTNWEL